MERKFVNFNKVKCEYVEKRWVTQTNLNNGSPTYIQDSFPRAYCTKQGDWCEYDLGLDGGCTLAQDKD